MRRSVLFGLFALALIACTHTLVPNPDPSHTHADFAVWINGTQLDFSAPEYMSAPPKVASVSRDASPFVSMMIPSVLAHGDENDGHVVPGREYLHLHDGNGHVIHMHKQGLSIGDFFASIGLPMTDQCLTLDEGQMKKFAAVAEAEKAPGYSGPTIFFGADREVCTGAMFQWQMFVNGKEQPFDPSYQPKDMDQILLSYNNGDTEQTQVKRELKALTDDACMYSKTCPWKGDPPTENCLADPNVPCVQ